jgi:hypothetical protein
MQLCKILATGVIKYVTHTTQIFPGIAKVLGERSPGLLTNVMWRIMFTGFLNMNLAPYYPSNIYNFAVAPKYLEDL